MKTKIKSHGEEVTDFYDKETLRVDSNRTCFAALSLDYDLRKSDFFFHSRHLHKINVKSYNPQVRINDHTWEIK